MTLVSSWAANRGVPDGNASPSGRLSLAISDWLGRGRVGPDLGEIDRNIVFYIVVSASFVEITSDLYTRNLSDFFRDDEDIVGWIGDVWQREELGHGALLRSYVHATWPDFDWNAAYQRFFDDFSPECAPTAMAASPGQELVALCVVETGTAGLYRMLAEATPEPGLSRIATGIANQEIGHYKQFLRHFSRYRTREEMSVAAILRAVWTQLTAIDGVDAYFAFKHVYLSRNPGVELTPSAYKAFRKGCRKLSRRHFPHRMAVRMLLRLLPLSAFSERMIVAPLALITRLLFAMA